jgi:exosortase A-associated hydrolase 2
LAGGAPEPFYLPATRGDRFCLHHVPVHAPPPRGGVLYVHPFAEEMNKSRRVAALQARELARQGWHVLQIDLFGCGDSAGDFGEATWEDWLDDVVSGVRWLQHRVDGPIWLWGLRSGALLAAQVSVLLDTPARLLLWQPTISGSQHLNQFLRLSVAGSALAGAADRAGVKELVERLESGCSIEVAGYGLNPAMAMGLRQAELVMPPGQTGVAWVEVSNRDLPTLMPASDACVESWRAAGRRVETAVVQGPSFWQTQEMTECPGLLPATSALVDRIAS